MSKITKFETSLNKFNEWREEHSDFIGYCNWQLFDINFMLESWTSKKDGIVIVQIWHKGHDFCIFKSD